MAKSCAFCNRKPAMGNRISRRGKAKYLGGVGRKTTGISKRKFYLNLQKVRVIKDGSVKRLWVCTRCIRSGKAERPQVKPAFTLPKM